MRTEWLFAACALTLVDAAAQTKEELAQIYTSHMTETKSVAPGSSLPASINPVSVEPLKAGESVLLLGTRPGRTARQPMSVEYVKQDGGWKVTQVLMGHIDMGQPDDYKEGFASIGGQIRRIDKQQTGTVYVIGVLDDEIAAFVPASLTSPRFVPGAILSLDGAMHREDKFRFLAEKVKLIRPAPARTRPRR